MEIRHLLLSNLNLQPTEDQQLFINSMSTFLEGMETSPAFILRGYAGTGKTTMVKTLCKSLPKLGMKSVLLAPTGRAAKVLSKYTGQSSSTIHRRIYSQESDDGQSFSFNLAHNRSKKTLFIVDEASMISGLTQQQGAMYAGSNLLTDLLSYVDAGEDCKVLFLGDVAQLPPVNERVSPSLSPKMLSTKYFIDAPLVELKQVLRQQEDSGILWNATRQRNRLLEGEPTPFIVPNYEDVINLSGYDVEDALQSAYADGREDCIIVTRSNKTANLYNQQVRHSILYHEAELEAGDLMMVVKNNYYWLDAKSKAGFVANGDAIELLSIHKMEERWGFKFATCDIRMLDYPQQDPFEVKLILNAIYSESPALTREESDRLYQSVLAQYTDVRNKRLLYLKLKEDPYFNALQVKFSYAITGHKAQGGQWKHVFVDQGYVNDDILGTEYMRWMYTAMTRATEKLYLLNFKSEFIDDL